MGYCDSKKRDGAQCVMEPLYSLAQAMTLRPGSLAMSRVPFIQAGRGAQWIQAGGKGALVARELLRRGGERGHVHETGHPVPLNGTEARAGQ